MGYSGPPYHKPILIQRTMLLVASSLNKENGSGIFMPPDKLASAGTKIYNLSLALQCVKRVYYNWSYFKRHCFQVENRSILELPPMFLFNIWHSSLHRICMYYRNLFGALTQCIIFEATPHSARTHVTQSDVVIQIDWLIDRLTDWPTELNEFTDLMYRIETSLSQAATWSL